MNRRFVAMSAALAVVGVIAPGYGAATALATTKAKVSCLLMKDPPGDAKLAGQGSNYAADDILSGDLASGKKTLVGVLRIASSDGKTGFPSGSTYRLRWTQTLNGATTYGAFFFYIYTTGGTSGAYGTSPNPEFEPSSSSTPLKVTRDKSGAITWVITRKDASLLRGTTFSHVTATTSVAFNYQADGVSGTSSTSAIDSAAGTGKYVDGQPSCVHAS